MTVQTTTQAGQAQPGQAQYQQVQLQTTASSGQHAVVVQTPEQQNQVVYQQDGSAQIQAGNSCLVGSKLARVSRFHFITGTMNSCRR